jgi:phosphatidylinositol glycan class P protein
VGRRGEPLKQQRREGRREGELDWRLLWREGTDAVMDIPIGGVCEILYGGGEEDEEGVGGYDEVEGGDGEGGFE